MRLHFQLAVLSGALWLLATSEHIRIGQDEYSSGDKAGDLVAKAGQAVDIVDNTVGQMIEVMQEMDVAGMFAKISKSLTMLGPVFMALSCVLSIVSIFLPQAASPEMEAIQKGFEKVNTRLDGMQGTISQMKLLVEISNVKSVLSNTFSEIDSLEVELLIAQKRGSKRAWNYFVEKYELNYKGAVNTLYYTMIGEGADAEFRFDLLDLYREKLYCSASALSRVCLVAMQTINRGLAIEGAYLGAKKYPSKVKELRKQWHNKLEKLRERCGEVIGDCLSRWTEMTNKAFDEFYKAKVHSLSSAEFAKELYYEMTSVVSNKAWAAYSGIKQPPDAWSFTTKFVTQDRWVRLDSNGKNVILAAMPQNPDPKFTNHQKLKLELEWTKEFISGDRHCYFNDQGGLYFTQSEHIAYAYFTRHPGVNVIVGKTDQHPEMVNTPNRSHRLWLGPTECLTRTYFVFVFW